MASERFFTGFEDARGTDIQGLGGMVLADSHFPARSGDFFNTLGIAVSPGFAARTHRLNENIYSCATNLSQVRGRMQVAVRWRQFPNNTMSCFGWYEGAGGLQQEEIVQALSTGQLQMTTGLMTAPATAALQLNRWYVCRFEFVYQRDDSGGDPSSLQLWVYDADTMDAADPADRRLVTQSQVTGVPAITNFDLGGRPTLCTVNPFFHVTDFDDWWYAVGDGADAIPPVDPDTPWVLNWPRGSRVQTCRITTQGSAAGFAGDAILCREIPVDTNTVTEQTATGSGLRTTFNHPTAATLGLIPEGQLATDGSAEEQEEAPPFDGAPVPDGLSSTMQLYAALPLDVSLPVPTIDSVAATAGAGEYATGVFVRAFTIEWRNPGQQMDPVCGPLSAATFISAAEYPNFAANVAVSFGAGTPADRFLNPASPASGWRRYGLGLLITNAYSGSSLLNPFLPSPVTTNLRSFAPVALAGNPFGAVVALVGTATPGGLSPPYPFTNPASRPNTVTFRMQRPVAGGAGGGVGEGQTVSSVFQYVFQVPAAVEDSELPVVEAIKVLVAAKRSSGSGNDLIVIDGTTYPCPVTTVYVGAFGQYAIDWTERDAGEFDALEFGFETASATATQLGNCMAEVLTAGPCTRKTLGPGQYQQKVGIYTPNGSYQTIPTGFTDDLGNPVAPTFVMVKKIGGVARPGACRAWWMGGTISSIINGLTTSPDTVAIMELNEEGFLVGPSAQTSELSATNYAYVAIYDGGQDTVNDAYFVTGSYARTIAADPAPIATANLGVSELFASGWTPDVVFVFGSACVMKTPPMTSPDSLIFNVTGLSTQGVIALGDTSFLTGTAGAVSSFGQRAYFAYRFDPGGLIATLFQQGSFAGTGGAQTIPTNFRAGLIVLDLPQAGFSGVFKSDAGNTAANACPWVGGSEGAAANTLTGINNADFTVGAAASVVGQTSYWMAWKSSGRVGNSGGGPLPGPGGGPPGGGPPTEPTNPNPPVCGGGGMPLPPGTIGGNGCTTC